MPIRASKVALPMCGTMKTFVRSKYSGCTAGSPAKTSRPAA